MSGDLSANLREPTATALSAAGVRPCVRGKFIFAGSEKLYVRGVTYGTFRPDARGEEFHDAGAVGRDFALMRANGVNAVRTYTVPPRWFLDSAWRHGLRVMVGLPWEQHVTFLDERGRGRSIERRVREGVRACAGHPAVLCYAIGNEIPASVVRWHGRRRLEGFLRRLYRAAKEEDPGGLVTYINYPSTEYLNLSFADFICFNVYLESQDSLKAYVARLQNIACDRPLVLTEIGLDSRRNGEEGQARSLDWQIRAAFAGGCAGAFVFSWTDEWYRGGHDIDDWDFGLTRRDRQAKPALEAVRRAFGEVPFPADLPWPRISVVVCTYNGERTIRDCLEGLLELDYPNYEVIVVNDGSTDATPAIVRDYGFRLISTENRGLSNARNTGMEAAAGEVVAYIDDDARPDPQWLTYLASTFIATEHAAVGGPNIAPGGDGLIAECVANAPGGPIHVLLSDQEAEHIPGCNMAIRRDALREVGGFDPQYRVAGDDVDVCWRLRQRGWTLGFHPAAIVWHHRRNSVRAYWRQQKGYGKAEALLERKWPEKYNAVGHLTWAGRLYGNGVTQALLYRRERVRYGTWGSALFQSVYQPAAGLFSSLPLMPEWYLVIAATVLLAALSVQWTPLLLSALTLFAVAVAATVTQAWVSAGRAAFAGARSSGLRATGKRALTACLHLLQPLARLYGRIRHDLTPWRRRGVDGLARPVPRVLSVWCEDWKEPVERLRDIEAGMRAAGIIFLRGREYDRWDLEVRGGMFGSARLLTAVEEHGAGKQLIRFRTWPRFSSKGLAAVLFFSAVSALAAVEGAWFVWAALGSFTLLLASRALYESSNATSNLLRGLDALKEGEAAGHSRARGEVHLKPAVGAPEPLTRIAGGTFIRDG